jgi:predicted anti-sigma-YlaC factor YlaD
MSCQDFAAALVDEHLPRPPGLEAHLEGCAACRSLARLHSSAASLRLPEPPAPAAIPREAILGVVRRRQHRRRMVASAGATAAVAALVLLVSPHVGGGPAEGYVPVEQPTRTAPRGQGSELVSIGELFDEVHGYTRTNPSVADETYQPFGALAAWVRPPDNTALDAEPFQSALAAFHVSQ